MNKRFDFRLGGRGRGNGVRCVRRCGTVRRRSRTVRRVRGGRSRRVGRVRRGRGVGGLVVGCRGGSVVVGGGWGGVVVDGLVGVVLLLPGVQVQLRDGDGVTRHQRVTKKRRL